MINTARKENLQSVHEMAKVGNFAGAIQKLKKLHEQHPSFPLYVEKIKEYEKKLKGNTASSAVAEHEEKGEAKESPADAQLVEAEIKKCIELASKGKTSEARKSLTESLSLHPRNLNILVALARVDLIDERFVDSLRKAKAVLEGDKQSREAYRIAEQAAIELGFFQEANSYFLSQPPVVNPKNPRQRGANPSLHLQFKLPPILGSGNDYRHIVEKAKCFSYESNRYTKKVSVIIPVFNRSQILANTLAALTHQTYPRELIEVLVVDDGSCDDVISVVRKYENRINLYYSRQPDKGFRLAAARNIGLRQAQGDVMVFMDADILPLPEDIEKYMKIMHVSEDALLIGHRRYVDVSEVNDDMILDDIAAVLYLPSINPNNDVADSKTSTGESIDWRFPVYERTEFLINDPWPFTKAAGGNIAFSRKLLEKAGYVDEEFIAWGCEDAEHGYRFFNAGAYFIPMMDIVSLHQEPLTQASPSADEDSFRKKGHAITKEIFSRKCPAPVVRRYTPGASFDVPKVSIYIPAYNAARYIQDAVQSCLDQSFGDLEVCICDDGSTDNTAELLEAAFGNNSKVRWVKQENGGIGKATNTAINMCRGMYIGQLDADDRLKPNAVRACVEVLDRNMHVDAVYGDCDYIDKDGKYIRDGWCGGEFSREWMTSGMIATPFRMFRKRLWSRTIGCNERIKNAVDLDLWLKFYEHGNIDHVHQILYSYRWHGENTSMQHRKQQEKNHLKVVSDSLGRQKLDRFWMVQSTGNKLNPREFKIVPQSNPPQVRPQDVVVLIPTCKRYYAKAEAVRNTWASQLSRLGYRYFFLVGNPELKGTELLGDVLHVPCKDDYESLLVKLAMGYEFIYRAMDFTHIYKIDDDCYLDVKKLTEDILPQLAGFQYAGGATHPRGAKMNSKWHFGKCSDSRFDKPYAFDSAPFEFAKGGYGYFLRRDVIPLIFEKVNEFLQELSRFEYSYEDVRVSQVLGGRSIFAHQIQNYTLHDGKNGLPSSNVAIVFDIKDPAQFIGLENNANKY